MRSPSCSLAATVIVDVPAEAPILVYVEQQGRRAGLVRAHRLSISHT
jgi:hypothetical protein